MQGVVDAGGLVGELGELSADRGVMLGFAGVEAGDLLAVGGEPVQQAGDRVVAGHHRVQGKEGPSLETQWSGTWSGMAGRGPSAAGGSSPM